MSFLCALSRFKVLVDIYFQLGKKCFKAELQREQRLCIQGSGPEEIRLFELITPFKSLVKNDFEDTSFEY